MKRTNIRVRQNGTKRAVIAQASTKPSAAVMLEFHADQSREVISRAEIAPGQFRSIKAAAKVAGLPVAKFLENGIGAKLRQLQAAAVESVTLVLFSEDGEEWTRVELPEPLFARLLMGAQACGQNLAEFLQQAAREKIARELAGKLSGAAASAKQERAALEFVAKSVGLRKPADLRCMADDLSREVAHLRLAAAVIERDGEAAWDREGAR